MTDSKPQHHRLSYGPIYADKFQGDMERMKAVFNTVQFRQVQQAGLAYTGASKRLQAAAADLHRLTSDLGTVWKGEDAEAAIKQMKRLQSTAHNLSAVTLNMGSSLTAFGDELESFVKNQPGYGFIKGWDFNPFSDEEQEAVDKYMAELGNRAVNANRQIPPEVTTDTPDIGRDVFERPKRTGTPTGSGGMPTGGGGIPTGGGGIPPGGVGLPKDPFGSPGNPETGAGSPPRVPMAPSPGGSDLAGLPGGPGSGGLGSDPFGRGGLGSGVGGGAGGIGGGAGVGGLGSAPMGAGGLTGGPAGAGRSGTAGRGPSSGAGAGSRSGGMMGGGAPGGGGGGGKGGEEHERSTWLVEDEDVWGAHDDETAPPVIG